MFGKRLSRALSFGLVAGALFVSTANGQNENNWHALQNGFDGIYPALAYGGGGLGLGLATNADGIGHWIAGEDLHGSTKRVSDGVLAIKFLDWQQVTCYFTPGGVGPADWQPFWTWFEADGGNENAPWIFTKPGCSVAGLISTNAFGPAFGSPPGTTASLVIAGIPSGIGTGVLVAPNNGLLPSSNGGSLNSVGSFFLGGLVGVPTGCIAWTIAGLTTAAAFSDNIDGVWNWHYNNPGGVSTLNKTYYGFSFNEVDIWNSFTLATVGAGTGVLGFPATTAYAYHWSTLEASTTAALAPNGADPFGAGGLLATYYTTTENNNAGIGGAPLLDFNGGYDTGRGARAISLAGTTGYADFNDVLAGGFIFAAQNSSGGSGGGGGAIPTLGFSSWSTRDYLDIGAPTGDQRITWVVFYWDNFFGAAPELQADVIIPAFETRVPVPNNILNPGSPGADFMQPLTGNLLPTFTHTTINSTTYPDPEGFPAGAGDFNVTGTSTQIPTGTASGGTCVGLPLAITYGTSCFDDGTSSGGAGTSDFTWDPSVGSISGRKVLFLLD